MVLLGHLAPSFRNGNVLVLPAHAEFGTLRAALYYPADAGELYRLWRHRGKQPANSPRHTSGGGRSARSFFYLPRHPVPPLPSCSPLHPFLYRSPLPCPVPPFFRFQGGIFFHEFKSLHKATAAGAWGWVFYLGGLGTIIFGLYLVRPTLEMYQSDGANKDTMQPVPRAAESAQLSAPQKLPEGKGGTELHQSKAAWAANGDEPSPSSMFTNGHGTNGSNSPSAAETIVVEQVMEDAAEVETPVVPHTEM